MEKIIISCSAEHLQYEFPKRKWYQFRKYDRIALMRLASVKKDILEAEILLQIYENFSKETISKGQEISALDKSFDRDFFCRIAPSYKTEVYEALLKQYHKKYHGVEHIILLDDGGDILPEFLYQLAEDKNYLSILTNTPEKYEYVLKQIATDFGLFGMVFAKQKELIRYIKQVPEDKKTLVLAGEYDKTDWNSQRQTRVEVSKGSLLYHLPGGSCFVDFSDNEVYRSIIYQKRMRFTYVSVPIFLDNVVQNRYNAIVNEGITFQVINDKKTIWRRKGNNDGRKEEHSDL